MGKPANTIRTSFLKTTITTSILLGVGLGAIFYLASEYQKQSERAFAIEHNITPSVRIDVAFSKLAL